jgi:hypothetical protein
MKEGREGREGKGRKEGRGKKEVEGGRKEKTKRKEQKKGTKGREGRGRVCTTLLASSCCVLIAVFPRHFWAWTVRTFSTKKNQLERTFQ